MDDEGGDDERDDELSRVKLGESEGDGLVRGR